MAEEHKAEMAKLSQDNEMLAQLVSRKDAEIDELNTVVQSWKPKVESLSEKEKEVSNLKVDVAKTQTSFLVRAFYIYMAELGYFLYPRHQNFIQKSFKYYKRYAENSWKTTCRMQLVENNSSKIKGGKLVEN